MSRFNIGDLVALKSGGPRMTVDKIGSPNVFCTWFIGEKKESEAFHPDSLEAWAEAEARMQREANALTATAARYDPLGTYR